MEWLCFHRVTNLSPYMESLSNAINQRSNKIQLTLWDQQLTDDDVIYLAGSLGNISRLVMRHTPISSDQCCVLKQAIEQLPSIQVHQLYPDILSTYPNVAPVNLVLHIRITVQMNHLINCSTKRGKCNVILKIAVQQKLESAE
ncbi:uncharacterized protein LOC144747124 [Ciona intestinalis]